MEVCTCRRLQADKYSKLGAEEQMANLPASEYVEVRDDGKVCIAGTRIGLDVFVYAHRRGKTPEALLEAYPSIRSLAKVQGAISFILGHPQAIDAYLREQDGLWDKFVKEHPIPDRLLKRIGRAREELSGRSA